MFLLPIFFFFVPSALKTFFSPPLPPAACSSAGLGTTASDHGEMRKSGFMAKKSHPARRLKTG
jgi:hypothetical protein